MAAERVQKILAKAGIASRRKAEELISEGAVTINGKVAQLGDKAELGKDAIKVKGKLLHHVDSPIYLAFHKPKGVLSTLSDPEDRPTLADYLRKVRVRVFPVGRLDFNSEGLLLLTNDGDFAQKLQERDDVVRVYQVKVKGHPAREEIAGLEKGARLAHHAGSRRKLVKPHSVRVGQELANKAMIEVAFLGSSAVDVKTYFETKGFLVERIVRSAIGHLSIRGLPPGSVRYLKASQIEALFNQPELGMRALKEAAGDEKPRPRPRAIPQPRALPRPRPRAGRE